MKTLIQIIKECCETGDEITFHPDYSGRGMFDKRCIGVSASPLALPVLLADIHKHIIEEVFEAAMDGDEDEAHNVCDEALKYVDILHNRCSDNLGLDKIYYWPKLEITEEELEATILPWQQRILNGCELLDSQLGFDWAQRIDLADFDIDSHHRCVLGQLFDGVFYNGLDRLKLSTEAAREYGFYPYIGESDRGDVIQLTALKNTFWREEIRRRQVSIKGESQS